MEERKRRWFPSQGAFWLSGRAFSNSDIWQIPAFEMAKIPEGYPMADLPAKVKEEMSRLYPNFLL